jgi:uncharacterized protein with von Willebrand factor type A (vWA) domain
MKRFLFLIILSFFFLFSKGQGCMTADILILMDWSGSEAGNEELLAAAALQFIEGLDVSENQVRVGVTAFADGKLGVVRMTGDRALLASGVRNLATFSAMGGTWIVPAVESGKVELNDGRPVQKIVVIISDGDIYDRDVALAELDALRNFLGAVVFAVQVGGDQQGFVNLSLLTRDANRVEHTTADGLVEALKKLNICN